MAMATSTGATLSIAAGGVTSHKLKLSSKHQTRFGVRQNIKQLNRSRKFSTRAEYGKLATHFRMSQHIESETSTGGGGDFLAGFILGGAVFGTLAYIFAPQIRRSLLNEDEYGFRKAKRLVYYDDGLEKTRQTLNAKISQLNAAIDNVSSRLRGGNNNVMVEPDEADAEAEASM